jgi:hypothetical protein
MNLYWLPSLLARLGGSASCYLRCIAVFPGVVARRHARPQLYACCWSLRVFQHSPAAVCNCCVAVVGELVHQLVEVDRAHIEVAGRTRRPFAEPVVDALTVVAV